MQYDKPFLTYEEQIDYLRDRHGLVIKDKDFAVTALKTVSYYDLINGYKESFMDEKEHYIDGITMERLFVFHQFDRSIQNVLFKYSVYAERKFKTQLAYVLAQDFGIHQSDYLDIRKYVRPHHPSRREKLSRTIECMQALYTDTSKYVDNPTRHYRNTKNHIPPWILIKNTSFSTASDLYSFLPKEQKNKVLRLMFPDASNDLACEKEIFPNALRCVRLFRNKIAHNLKFVTFRMGKKHAIKLVNLQKMLPDVLITKSDIEDRRGANDPYGMLLSLIWLIQEKNILLELVFDMLLQIEKVDCRNTDVDGVCGDYYRITNFPTDLDLRLKKLTGVLYERTGLLINSKIV